jgi:hypothetical protein
MSAASNRYPGLERRRHFRVEGDWTIRVDAVDETGAVSEFEGRALNISMSGILLEASVDSNLWVDKNLTLILPGAGPVPAVVRRFIEYAADGHKRTRWGIEFGALDVHQSGNWARFIFTEAHRLGQESEHQAFNERHGGRAAGG